MVFPKVLTYIVVLALCAMDFWLTQNIIGRKLVKLRWWYMIDDSTGGEEVWLFESKDRKSTLIIKVFDTRSLDSVPRQASVLVHLVRASPGVDHGVHPQHNYLLDVRGKHFSKLRPR